MGDTTGTAEPSAAAVRRRVGGWMMFDFASQPFYTLCLTFIFGPYFVAVLAEAALLDGVESEASKAQAQQVWSWTQSGIGFAIALSAPLLGAFADRSGNRMPWVWAFSVMYALGAAGLWVMAPDGSAMWLAIFAFGLLMIGAEYTTIFTNAMLPGLAPPGQEGRISGNGYAIGYAGGVLALIVMLLAFADNETGTTLLGGVPALGLNGAEREGTRFVGPFTALWFIVFMVPFFLLVREPKMPKTQVSLALAWADVKSLLAQLPGRPSLSAFLAGSMLYRDGLVALYSFGGTYAVLVLGWETTQVGVFGIVGAITAAIASYIGGGLDEKYGPKPVIVGATLILASVVIVLAFMAPDSLFGVPIPTGWTGTGVVAFIMGADYGLADVFFLLIGAVIGGAGGVLQAASRTMMVRHADPEKATEAFGLYALAGKATAFIAPLSIGLATLATGSARLGIIPVAVLFLIGLLLLRWVKPEGDVGR
ncbi:MAG: MFS transporter [Pseudomonadota bacterium]